MKRRIAGLLATVALAVSGAASLGCFFLLYDEPNSNGLFND